jgi:rhodanese-related sulfurtransferase
MARAVELDLRAHQIDVRLSMSATAVRPLPGGGLVVDLSEGRGVPADLVLLAAGVRPQTALAAEAGLALGLRGALLVDEHLRTSVPSIYGVGDAIQVIDAVTGTGTLVPLAGPANRQGRAAANHLFGRPGGATPVLGTAIVRVFDTVAATTGRSENVLRTAGIAHHVVHVHPGDHAGYYPDAHPIHLKLTFAPDGRILGAQATGSTGVDKRIDVIATAIRAGMSVHDLADLELAYAPPFGSAKDPVNMAGFAAANVLAGDLSLWRGRDLAGRDPESVLLDVRSPAEFAAGHLPGALNIPHTQLRARLDEIPASAPVWVYCASGFRSYLALRVLLQNDWAVVRSLSGGLRTLRLERADLELVEGGDLLTAGR